MKLRKQQGFSLPGVMVAVALASIMSLSWIQHIKRDMDQGMISLSAKRMQLVYESAITYRGDLNAWPGNTAVLTIGNYLPAAAALNAWDQPIQLTPQGNNLLISTVAPTINDANQIAGKMPAATVTGTTVTDTIVPPGQEASNAALYALDGSRALTGNMDVNGNEIQNAADVSLGTGQSLATALMSSSIMQTGTNVVKPDCPTGTTPDITVKPVTVCDPIGAANTLSAFHTYADNYTTYWRPRIQIYINPTGWKQATGTCGQVEVTTFCR